MIAPQSFLLALAREQLRSSSHHENICADRLRCLGPAARYAISSVAFLCVTQLRDTAHASDMLIFCQASLLLLPMASTLKISLSKSLAVRCPMLPMDIPRPT